MLGKLGFLCCMFWARLKRFGIYVMVLDMANVVRFFILSFFAGKRENICSRTTVLTKAAPLKRKYPLKHIFKASFSI